MDESVIVFLLHDLKREGMTESVATVEGAMKVRWQVWTQEDYP
jgi:hypothetical protein